MHGSTGIFLIFMLAVAVSADSETNNDMASTQQRKEICNGLASWIMDASPTGELGQLMAKATPIVREGEAVVMQRHGLDGKQMYNEIHILKGFFEQLLDDGRLERYVEATRNGLSYVREVLISMDLSAQKSPHRASIVSLQRGLETASIWARQFLSLAYQGKNLTPDFQMSQIRRFFKDFMALESLTVFDFASTGLRRALDDNLCGTASAIDVLYTAMSQGTKHRTKDDTAANDAEISDEL